MKNKSNNILHLTQPKVGLNSPIDQQSETKRVPVKNNRYHSDINLYELELEIKNEELQCIQESLERTLQRYVSHYEFAPVGYITISKHEIIEEANLTVIKLLGEDRTKILNKNIRKYIHPDDIGCWHKHFLKNVLQGKTAACELRMLDVYGKTFYARFDCLIVNPADLQHVDINQSQIRVAITDITDIKLAEKELHVAATVFNSQQGMMVIDSNELILKVNVAFSNVTGYTLEEVVGLSPKIFISGDHNANFYDEILSEIKLTGAWQGEVSIMKKNGDTYPTWFDITAVKNLDGLIENFVATLLDISPFKVAENEMKELAFYDHLTKLPNRRLMLDRMNQGLAASDRSQLYYALMFVDLDNFKALNDTLGHDIGDLMLQEISHRLSDCVRAGDTVARIGGDEFMIMLENLSKTAKHSLFIAESVGNKIIAAINEPFHLAGHDCTCSASIGLTLFTGHLYTVEELQKQADIAMYQAKAAGRNMLRIFKRDSRCQ
jgi:diguanylate cyclase (GGDEF)-like protein/PAS domain S-box-containing protein